jgi:predicted NBD/HSP70 family sugar kinase
MFNPLYPPNFNSLNGLVFAELPDECPQSYWGKKGYDFLSLQALIQHIQANLTQLELGDSAYSSFVPAFFVRLEEGNPTAIKIMQQMGQALGLILLTLHDATEWNRLANPSKDAAYWDYWGRVNQVYIGGGLASGKAGEIMAHEAQKLCSGIRVIAAEHPQYLPLMGAARYVPTGRSALVLDFGGTSVKRAITRYEDGLSQLELLPSLPFDTPRNSPQAIFDNFISILAKSYTKVESAIIPVSIAAYVDEKGQPYHNQHGIYMQMASLSDNLPHLLSSTLSKRIGRDVHVKLLHDGTAAASFFSPLENAAVITIGTAIGSGYPVPRPNLRPINPNNLRVNNR